MPTPGVIQDLECLYQVVEVVEWSAHAHDRHVAQGSERTSALGREHFRDDLMRFEVSFESCHTACAESAAEFASHLGGDAKRSAVFGGDQNAFDSVPAGRFEKPLDTFVIRLFAGAFFERCDFEFPAK